MKTDAFICMSSISYQGLVNQATQWNSGTWASQYTGQFLICDLNCKHRFLNQEHHVAKIVDSPNQQAT